MDPDTTAEGGQVGSAEHDSDALPRPAPTDQVVDEPALILGQGDGGERRGPQKFSDAAQPLVQAGSAEHLPDELGVQPQ